ncbi:predicted protein [Lichtheimia corymbifera JMRC:FSU:9682]|uniref:Uncharacterized protein n=1 Tax=Lichtheimia corymbifera JMRC:FSU:9682 TaxID=1263082 RepID=A0A068S3D6_9FUNG|nr:predicted protein [Lichtheimia corymbifera JMRC:FSU:9682]
MAIQVLRHKQNATLERDAVEEIAKDVKECSRVKAILDAISKLYGDASDINIIANEELNKQAEESAAILSSYLTKGNKSIIGPAILDYLKTY